jgi:hypothetical protein
MTQTFHISPDYRETARCLDLRRLNKNITEAFQVFRWCIGEGKRQGNPHPYNMWLGYEESLLEYIQEMHLEWNGRYDAGLRGGVRTHKNGLEATEILGRIDASLYPQPYWIEDERLISSQRSALLYKDFEWYSQFGWTEKPAVPTKINKNGSVSLPYFWPDKEKK